MQSYKILIDKDFQHDFFDTIKNAQKRIYLQFMTFEGDTVGWTIANLLIAAKKRGVKVRIIVDYFSDYFVSDTYYKNTKVADEVESTKRMFQTLRNNGIPVYRTNPYGKLFTKILFRNHKKIVIVDDYAYLGGINISDHNFDWHDFMVRFDDREIIDFLVYDLSLTVIDKYKSINYKDRIFTNAELENKYYSLLAKAKNEIVISSPYLLDVNLVNKLDALSDDITIKIFTIQDNNIKIFNLINDYIFYRLSKKNIEIYFYKRFSHAKFLMIDSSTILFGSSNFDLSGLLLNNEIGLVENNKEFVDDMKQKLIYNVQDNLDLFEYKTSYSRLVRSFILSKAMYYVLHSYKKFFIYLKKISNNKKFVFLVSTYVIVSLFLFLFGFHIENKTMEFIGFMMLGGTFLTFPADTYVLHLGAYLNPIHVGLIGGFINGLAVLAEKYFISYLLHKGKAKRIKKIFHKSKFSHYFNKAPFIILIVFSVSFIPYEPFRFLAIVNDYNNKKYMIATFIGRGIRYYLLVLLGAYLAQFNWLGRAIVISLLIYFARFIWKNWKKR